MYNYVEPENPTSKLPRNTYVVLSLLKITMSSNMSGIDFVAHTFPCVRMLSFTKCRGKKWFLFCSGVRHKGFKPPGFRPHTKRCRPTQGQHGTNPGHIRGQHRSNTGKNRFHYNAYTKRERCANTLLWGQHVTNAMQRKRQPIAKQI